MNQFETRIFESTVAAVKECFGLELTEADFAVETPRDKTLGDYAVSVAMKLARTLHKSPMDIAEPIAEKLRETVKEAESVTVARPGFINFKMKQDALSSVINQVLDAGDKYGYNDSGKGKRVLVRRAE